MQETGSKIEFKHSVYDESFRPERPEAYNLFILVNSREILCAVSDHKGQTFVALESWTIPSDTGLISEHLAEAFSVSAILNKEGYRNIICCSGFFPPVLVPIPLFDAETTDTHYQFSQRRHTGCELMIDKMTQAEANNIYEIPDEVIRFFNNRYPDVVFNHTSTAQIGFLISANRNSDAPLMTVNVHDKLIEVYVVKGKKLEFCNWFNYESAEELVYYLLFICEQLHLNPETIDLRFAGAVSNQDAAFLLAEKYIRHISLAQRPDLFHYPESFNELPQQTHFHLFSQLICVS